MILETIAGKYRRVRRVNAADDGFPTKSPTGTEPAPADGNSAAQATAAAVIDLGNRTGGVAQNVATITPYGAGADNATFSMRVIGWRLVHEGLDYESIWIPVVLGEFLCTLSTQVGVAGRVVAETDRLCDTVALVGFTANDDIDVSICSPANNTAGHVTIDLKGFQKLELTFTTGGSATSCNALLAMY